MAARFWVNTGSSTNWSATGPTNWAATSGSTTKVAVPGSSDDVTFDGAGNGNSASVVSANITILSLTFTAGYTNTVTINTTVVLTIAGNFTDNTAHSWTVNGTGSMTISAASTITSNSKTFPGNVTFSGANTKTLSGNWTITGQLTIAATTTFNSAVLTAGGLVHSAAALTGTTAITLTGGNWTGSAGSGQVSNPITIAGNVTFTTSVALGAGGSLTYSSGTVTTTGSTLYLNGTPLTLDTNGIIFNNINFVSTVGTITINSLLTATGTVQINSSTSPTLAGTAGFMITTLTCLAIDARTLTLKNGITYTVVGTLDFSTARKGGTLTVTSDHASNRANFVLLNTSTVCNVLAHFTRIDASAGRPIITFNGTVTDCINVATFANVLFKPVTSFNRGARRSELTNKNKSTIYL